MTGSPFGGIGGVPLVPGGINRGAPGGVQPGTPVGPAGGRPGGGAMRPGGGARGGSPHAPDPGDEVMPERGRDFFADRVMDDPKPSLLYDPQLDPRTAEDVAPAGLLQMVGLQAAQPQPQPQTPATAQPAPPRAGR